MNDDHIKSEIGLYLSGGLTESRNRQIEAHAASCDKCRNAITKARAKQSRLKREALKKASTDHLPNLFLARQGKESGASEAPFKIPWVPILLLLAAGVGYKFVRHSSFFTSSQPIAAADVAPPVVQASTTTVPSPTAVATSLAVSSAPVVQVQQEWQGPDSGVKEVRVVVIRNKEAWDKLRADMGNPLPEIDFEQHVVLGAFVGERTAGSTVTFGKMKESEDEVVAPYRIHMAEVQISTITASAPSHPYVLSLIAQTGKKIRLTQREAQ